MGFLVDTGIWISVERGDLSAADVHDITRNERVFLSPINLAELQMGIELMEDPGRRQRALATIRRLKRKPLLRIDGVTAEVFGTLAGQLRRAGRGHQFRIQDLWLAAQAVQRSFKLLSANVKDFEDIPGLDLIPVEISKLRGP